MSILVLTSDTLIGTPAAGNLEYNGQFFGTDSNASRAQLQRITQGTAQATTSGTSKDFTGIPAWVKRITVMFNGVSTNGSNIYQIQIGAGSVTTSGYAATAAYTGASALGYTLTTGICFVPATTAANSFTGLAIITNISSNAWVASSNFGRNDGYQMISSGSITLGGTLDRVRITTVGGTDTFDAGSINILYEG